MLTSHPMAKLPRSNQQCQPFLRSGQMRRSAPGGWIKRAGFRRTPTPRPKASRWGDTASRRSRGLRRLTSPTIHISILAVSKMNTLQETKLARICKVLSVETRLRILSLLRCHPLCVGALAAHLDITQGAVSQHLRILRDAGVVSPERRGYYVHYAVNEDALTEWMSVLVTFFQSAPHPTSCTPPEKGDSPCVTTRPSARSRRS